MILFTGRGALAEAFSEIYPCNVISARNMDEQELKNWISKAEVIIHNAALIHSGNFEEFIESNFILTKRILDIAFKVKPQLRFINISSMSFLANQHDYLTPALMDDYAFSKFISEQFCIRHPFKDLTNVRFSTIFYGDENRDGISKLVYDSIFKKEITIYNGGEAKRDIIPIRIASLYLYKLCNSEKMNRTTNIVSGYALSFGYIVRLLQKLNPALKINNIIVDNKEVLSDFSKDDIKRLGEIEFNIEGEINAYINRLNENFNL